jgi:hypothetical protein
VGSTMFEYGQAVKARAIRPASLMRKVGLEPPPPGEDRILSQARPTSAWCWVNSDLT